MTKLRSTKIHLKGGYSKKEAITEEAIKPGHLLELTSTGTIQKQTRTGDALATLVPFVVAVEPDVIASDTNGIDTAYPTGDLAYYGTFQKGAEVQMIVAVGAVAIAQGAVIQSAGDGTVITGAATQAIGIALEAVDNSAGSVPVFIKVEVL